MAAMELEPELELQPEMAARAADQEIAHTWELLRSIGNDEERQNLELFGNYRPTAWGGRMPVGQTVHFRHIVEAVVQLEARRREVPDGRPPLLHYIRSFISGEDQDIISQVSREFLALQQDEWTEQLVAGIFDACLRPPAELLDDLPTDSDARRRLASCLRELWTANRGDPFIGRIVRAVHHLVHEHRLRGGKGVAKGAFSRGGDMEGELAQVLQGPLGQVWQTIKDEGGIAVTDVARSLPVPPPTAPVPVPP